MSGPELPVPLSAVALRVADEVGHAVLDRVAADDLAAAAELDQHVAAVRAGLASCSPEQPQAARLAGHSAALAGRQQPGRSQPGRPHHARRTDAAHDTAIADARPLRAAVAMACPDMPFADNPWQSDAAPAVRPLLHYACGFVEAAVRADWWPVNPAVGYQVEWHALRLAAVCRLIRAAESAAALPPALR